MDKVDSRGRRSGSLNSRCILEGEPTNFAGMLKVDRSKGERNGGHFVDLNLSSRKRWDCHQLRLGHLSGVGLQS